MRLRPIVLLCVLIAASTSFLPGLLGARGAAGSATAAGLSLVGPVQNVEPLPPGASVQTLLTELDQPIAMAFDPAGRLFFTERSTGKVRLYAGGRLQDSPVITFQVNSAGEHGLLGIAIDPNFTANHFIYVYYTCSRDEGCPLPPATYENRVVRFTENNGVGSNLTVIFTSPQTAPNHVGGSIHFGPDGKLYVTVGDNANAANSQDLTVKNGKMHRINPDGSIPADNPKFNQPAALPSIYAIGLRNTFGFVFDPVVRGRIFASENGPSCDDEMNRIEAGYNYGWRAGYPCDDASPDARFNSIAPLFYMPSGACCKAPTGITVYTGSQIPQWQGHVFMANYEDAPYDFTLNADRIAATSVAQIQGLGPGLSFVDGPDGALYYIEGGGYQPGSLKRVVGASGPAPTTTPGPSAGGTVPPPVPLPGTGSRTYPETGQTVSGIFLNYWDTHGGLMQQGFPISGLIGEVSDLDGNPCTVQYFERAVFEYHPENQAPFNVLLSQLGTFQYRRKYPAGAPGQRPNTSPGSVLFSETGKRLGGRFLQYWREHGGLMQQGYPISDEFTEVSDLNGNPYTVQYFERAVFEYHPENKAPYDVLLSQLGTLHYRAKYGGK